MSTPRPRPPVPRWRHDRMSRMTTEIVSAGPVVLPLVDYARSVGRSVRTVERWIAHEQLPDARRVNGHWLIPAGTPTPDFTRAEIARQEAAPLPALTRLVDAARALGTTPGRVLVMADAGVLRAGKWGPGGSWAVLTVDIVALQPGGPS